MEQWSLKTSTWSLRIRLLVISKKSAILENRSRAWYRGDEPLSALKAFLAETDRFEVDPVVNGKLIFSSSPGGYLRCLKA